MLHFWSSHFKNSGGMLRATTKRISQRLVQIRTIHKITLPQTKNEQRAKRQGRLQFVPFFFKLSTTTSFSQHSFLFQQLNQAIQRLDTVSAADGSQKRWNKKLEVIVSVSPFRTFFPQTFFFFTFCSVVRNRG